MMKDCSVLLASRVALKGEQWAAPSPTLTLYFALQSEQLVVVQPGVLHCSGTQYTGYGHRSWALVFGPPLVLYTGLDRVMVLMATCVTTLPFSLLKFSASILWLFCLLPPSHSSPSTSTLLRMKVTLPTHSPTGPPPSPPPFVHLCIFFFSPHASSWFLATMSASVSPFIFFVLQSEVEIIMIMMNIVLLSPQVNVWLMRAGDSCTANEGVNKNGHIIFYRMSTELFVNVLQTLLYRYWYCKYNIASFCCLSIYGG